MDASNLQDWLQIAGLFGVIVSLAFVTFEIRQTRQIAIADVYQQRSAMGLNLNWALISSEPLDQSLRKLFAGETLDSHDEFIGEKSWNMVLFYYENVHFQHQQGLMSNEQWDASRTTMQEVMKTPGFREFWSASRHGWRRSFAEVVDALITEM